MELNREEIRKWLKNKDVRVWRRALFLLYDEGALTNIEVADTIGADQRGVRRSLTLMQHGYPPYAELKKHKWYITPGGIKKVEYGQKHGDKFPIRVR